MYNPDQGWLLAEIVAGDAKGICWKRKQHRKPFHCFSKGIRSSGLPPSASSAFLCALKQPHSGQMLDLSHPTEVWLGAESSTVGRGAASVDDGRPWGSEAESWS